MGTKIVKTDNWKHIFPEYRKIIPLLVEWFEENNYNIKEVCSNGQLQVDLNESHFISIGIYYPGERFNTQWEIRVGRDYSSSKIFLLNDPDCFENLKLLMDELLLSFRPKAKLQSTVKECLKRLVFVSY